MRATISIRLATRGGHSQLSGFTSESTLGELVALAAEKLGVPPADVALATGFPPKPLVGLSTSTLTSFAVCGRVKITARSCSSESGSVASLSDAAAAPSAQRAPVANWACPRCTYANAMAASACAMCDTQRAAAPAGARVASASTTSMRVHKISADNSCLFASIAHLVLGTVSTARELRSVCARAVLDQPGVFTATVLGKEPRAYARWIEQPSSWGGEIELSILADHLRCCLIVHDVQHRTRLAYGSSAFPCCAFLAYTGIHYDALVAAAAAGTAGATTFASGDAAAEAGAAALVAELNATRQFTHVAGMTIECMECRKALKGVPQASAHAHATGHTRFGEMA